MDEVVIPKLGAVSKWRQQAGVFLAAGVSPSDIIWRRDGDQSDLFTNGTSAAPPPANGTLKISRPAIVTIEQAIQHSDPEVFARAYSVVWRMHAGTLRWADRSDAEMATLLAHAKQIARDIHKMHAFVRFREVPSDTDRRRFGAWFEPQHNIVEAAAPFFAKRFGDMDWVIATPSLTARFVEGELTFELSVHMDAPPQDATEDLWRTYYGSIFNPARLMTKAMCAEMPKKYWKNLPEAELIPDLIRSANARATRMQTAAPTLPGKLARIVKQPRVQNTLTYDIQHQAASCTRCAIGACATQTVWGEGSLTAQIMLVGEQPGDREDLEGRPFVGPAGQLLDRALKRAGLLRTELYLTNAVKHFKYSPRGKRRIHARPNVREIETCRWWLNYEIKTVAPQFVIAMGATAARALTGNGNGLERRRGQVEQGLLADKVFLSVHPASILRQTSDDIRTQKFDHFVRDLSHAKSLVAPSENA